MIRKTLHPATLAAQALGSTDAATGAVVLPIHTATTFLRDADNQYRRGHSYGRADNPTYDQPQALLTALEGGAATLLFSSGMAAAAAVFQCLPRDSHVVAPQVMYWGLRSWLRNFAEAWGLAVDFVDATSLDALRRAVSPNRTRLIWIETPANPLWSLTDIAGSSDVVERGRLPDSVRTERIAFLRTLHGTQRASAPNGCGGTGVFRGCNGKGIAGGETR